jgi:hypothetical protein
MQFAYKTTLLSLWKKPKKTFNTINQYGLYKYQTHLFIIAGINNTINRQFIDLADNKHELFSTLASSVAAGALFGWLGFLVVSGLIYITGKWIKGQATSTEITNMVSYATLPFLVSLAFTLICVLLLRVLGFQNGAYNYVRNWHNTYYIIIKIHYYVYILITIYYFILLTIGVSVVQGFSIRKSLLNLVMCIAIVVIPIALIILCIFR